MTTSIRGAVLTEIGAARPYRDSAPLQIRELDLAEPRTDELGADEVYTPEEAADAGIRVPLVVETAFALTAPAGAR